MAETIGLGLAGNVANFLQLMKPVIDLATEFCKAPERIKVLHVSRDRNIQFEDANLANTNAGAAGSIQKCAARGAKYTRTELG